MNVTEKLPVLLLLVVPIAITVCGLLSLRVKTPRPAVIVEGCIRVATIVWFIVHAAFVIPEFRRTFDDFGTELPAITSLLFDVSDIPLVVLVVTALIGEVALFIRLRDTEGTGSSARRLSIATTLLVACLFCIVLVSLLVPLTRLLDNLA